jgi:hypothetical protein
MWIKRGKLGDRVVDKEKSIPFIPMLIPKVILKKWILY